jgi:hypothetical protein
MKKVKSREQATAATRTAAGFDHSDEALRALCARIKLANDPAELRRLSEQLERVIFHKQFENAERELRGHANASAEGT